MKITFPFGFDDGSGHRGNEALRKKMLRLIEAEMQKHVNDAGITGVKIEFDPRTSEIIATGESRSQIEKALLLFADDNDHHPEGSPH